MEKPVYMTPKQPLFVVSSENYMKCIMNRLGIVHFYQCNPDEQSRYAIPDGCVDMVFYCDPSHPSAQISGTVLAPKQVLKKSKYCYFGVRFLPGYNPILGMKGIMKDLVNHDIPFEELIQDHRMLEGICSTSDFKKQIEVFIHSYISIYRRIQPMENSNLLVLHTANKLIHSSGCMPIEKIADETGYTIRYLDRCFRQETGISPKQFAKILRFQAAISALNELSKSKITDIAIDLGYFDQAHLVHDFKAYTGYTPKKYQNLLEQICYHKKLQITTESL